MLLWFVLFYACIVSLILCSLNGIGVRVKNLYDEQRGSCLLGLHFGGRRLGEHGCVGIVFLSLDSNAVVVLLQSDGTEFLFGFRCEHIFHSVVLSDATEFSIIFKLFTLKASLSKNLQNDFGFVERKV